MPLKDHFSSLKASVKHKVSREVPSVPTQDATTTSPERSQLGESVAGDPQVNQNDAAIPQPEKESSNDALVRQASEHDDFWDRAYKELKVQEEELMSNYEACLAHHDKKRSASTSQVSAETEATAEAESKNPPSVQMRALLQTKIKDDEDAV